MQVKSDAAAAEAEFAEVLAELEAEQGGETAPEEAAPEADSSEGDPEADEEASEEIEEKEAEPVATDVERLAELLDAGDLKGLAEALGRDPEAFKLNPRQFKAARRAQADAARDRKLAEEARAAAERATADVAGKAKRAEETYGPIYDGFQAYKQGDPSGVREAIERMCGDSYENVAAKIARAAKGLDPGQVEVIKLRRELAARDEAAAKERAAAEAKQVEARDLSNIESRLKGTSLEGIDGAAADIAKVLRASVDARLGKPTKTLKEAFLEVKAGYAKRAAELAKVVRKPAPPPKPEREPLAPRKTAPAGSKKLTAEEEFAMELAAAKRMTADAERKIRRSGK